MKEESSPAVAVAAPASSPGAPASSDADAAPAPDAASPPDAAALPVERPWVTWSLLVANVAVYCAMAARGVSLFDPTGHQLVDFGGNLGVATVADHQWWRLVSSAFVHVGMFHIAVNMAALYVIGRPLERIFGHFRFAVVYALSGVAGALASLLVHPDVVSVGASGALFGIYAAAAALRLRAPARASTWPPLLRDAPQRILVWLLIYAFVPGIDNAGHAGGVLIGAALGLLLHRARPIAQQRLGAVAVVVMLAVTGGIVQRRVSETPAVRALALAYRASAAYERGDDQAAIAAYDQALALHSEQPDPAFLHFWRGMAWMNRGDYEHVALDADAILANNAKSAEGHYLRCYVELQRDRYDAAVSECNAALSDAAPLREVNLFGSAYALRGAAWMLRRSFAEARADFSLAIVLEPDNAGLYAKRGTAELALKLRDEASADFERATQLQPRVARYLAGLCNVRRVQGRFDEARAICERAAALDPREPVPQLLIPDLLFRLGRMDEALGKYDAMIAGDSKNGYAYNGRAWVRRIAGQAQVALADADRAVALEPKSAAVHGTRCFIETELGKRREALADCARAVELNPTAAADTGMLHFLQGDMAAARADWERAIADGDEIPRELEPFLSQSRRAAR